MLEFNAYDLICPKISFDRLQYRVAYMNFHVYYFSYSLDVITAFFIATKATYGKNLFGLENRKENHFVE